MTQICYRCEQPIVVSELLKVKVQLYDDCKEGRHCKHVYFHKRCMDKLLERTS
ncbi:hypothetical protein LCGC14_1500850 [marine sediment metagenome]|uniref:Uncharacterized protein n=1 Tax=marine sediment metagenome TaxID=412755 RepID=A0A0F9J437_9ZZZZ